MDLLKKCLIEFNNQWTNKITEKEVDDDELLRFTLLDMQDFAKKYAEAITVTHSCKSDSEQFICPNGCGQNGDLGSCYACVGK